MQLTTILNYIKKKGEKITEKGRSLQTLQDEGKMRERSYMDPIFMQIERGFSP